MEGERKLEGLPAERTCDQLEEAPQGTGNKLVGFCESSKPAYSPYWAGRDFVVSPPQQQQDRGSPHRQKYLFGGSSHPGGVAATRTPPQQQSRRNPHCNMKGWAKTPPTTSSNRQSPRVKDLPSPNPIIGPIMMHPGRPAPPPEEESQPTEPAEFASLLPAEAGEIESSEGLTLSSSSATQILVKNTFIQLDSGIPPEDTKAGATRPRGESCDAVILTNNGVGSFPPGKGPPSSKPAVYLEFLNCIPEQSGSGDAESKQDEELTDPSSPQAGTEVCVGTDSQVPVEKDWKAASDEEGSEREKGASSSASNPKELSSEEVRVGISPSELTDSLSSCGELRKVALEDLPVPSHEKTTVMLRNIPNKYTQSMLLKAVNQEFEGLYDFFYLPIDFKNKCNVGYAFINFIHPFYAELFSKKFSGMKLMAFKSKKICEISWGRVQGFRANIEHYRNSAIMSIPNSQYRPLVFKDGIALQFLGNNQIQQTPVGGQASPELNAAKHPVEGQRIYSAPAAAEPASPLNGQANNNNNNSD